MCSKSRTWPTTAPSNQGHSTSIVIPAFHHLPQQKLYIHHTLISTGILVAHVYTHDVHVYTRDKHMVALIFILMNANAM